MDTLEHFSHVLESVYDAAAQPELWPATLKRICDWLHADKALLFTPLTSYQDGGFAYIHNLAAEEMDVWSSAHVGQDFWTMRVVERGLAYEGATFRDSNLSLRSEFLASDYYRLHLRRMDIGWLMAAVVLNAAQWGLPGVACSLYRNASRDTGFSDEAYRNWRLLLPHLSRAVGVMLSLRHARVMNAASLGALDALSSGVVLLDSRGSIVHANQQAVRILERADGLQTSDKRIFIQNAADSRAWLRSLQATLQPGTRVAHFAEALRVRRDTPGQAYLLQLSTLSHRGGFGHFPEAAKVIVFITEEHAHSGVDTADLIKLYKLSPAEARTAAALASGGSLQSVADRVGVSLNTIKSQLRQVYQKTGCNTRSDLARLLLSLGRVGIEAHPQVS